MAYNERDVPETVQDILTHMPREMRQRVLADYESHYAPFLAMLAGWKGAIQEHYIHGEASVIAKLEEQFFPMGEWKCPAQTLAIPQRPPERATEIDGDTQFIDPVGRPWLASGNGWLLPTTLRSGQAQWVNDDCFFVIEADHAGKAPLEPLLRRGQLLFAALSEDAVAVMADSPWWVLLPDGSGYRRARLTRYDGYLSFEREMQTARLNQRHLDLWLPAFHPYGRKIACLTLDERDGVGDLEAPDLGWLGRGVQSGFRFVGRMRPQTERHRRALAGLRDDARRAPAAPLVHLNPVPVVQTALADSVFYPPFRRIGEQYALHLSGVPDLFAAVANQDAAAMPVSIARLPGMDPKATEPEIQVQFHQAEAQVTRVKLYHSSVGGMNSRDAPSVLETTLTKLRFDVPFHPLGGAVIGGATDRADWVRTAWYHSVLRPPLLTEGDLAELIRQRRGAVADLVQFHRAAREIAHDAEAGDTHWRSYLWPTVVASQDSYDARYGEIPAPDVIPLVQTLRVSFKAAPTADAPPFLLSAAADYLASVLSQYFVLSCFRVEGQVV